MALSRILPAIACVLAPAIALAQTPEEFYRGRQITMLVGAGAGGGYDVYARVWAKHASRHIPGQPQIVAKNMPAAGGIAAANALYNNSDRDGSVFAALPNGVSMDPLAGVAQARFEPLKMAWVGSIGKLQNVCATWHTSPVKTIAQARQRETIVAGAGATSNTAIMPRIINELIGTRFKVVAGYDPTGGLNMALERGEAEGICGLSWSTMKASRPHWIKDKLLNVIVQVGVDKLSDLPDVPSALDLVQDGPNRQVLELILIRQEIGRPIVLPLGVPADRVAALRTAFEATLKDAAFLAEAEKSGMEIEPLTGREVEAMLAKAYAAPPAIVARMVDLLTPASGGGVKAK
jgi:tripartite-type tricarboxylate transporter receptor subunit TctC